MRMSLTGPRFLESAGVERMVRDGVERLQALPGVEVGERDVLRPARRRLRPAVRDRRPAARGYRRTAAAAGSTISPGYFDVFKIPIKRGRAFTERDTATAPPVVIINEAMAQAVLAEGRSAERPADRSAASVMREFADEPERQIIGVVGDVRDGGLNNDPQPTMYIAAGRRCPTPPTR